MGSGRALVGEHTCVASIFAALLLGVVAVASAAPAEELRRAIAEAKPEGNLDSALHRLLERGRPAGDGRVARAAAAGTTVDVSIALRSDRWHGLEAMLSEVGARILHRIPGLIEARVEVSSLTRIVQHPAVSGVRAVSGPWAGGAASHGSGVEAADEGGAALVQAPPGIDGTGVRVGIIDVGFAGYSALIGSHLPEPSGVRCYVAVGEHSDRLEACESPPELFLGSLPEHGTAVVEALLAVAPGVELLLANPPSPLDLHATVDWMIEQGVDVVNYSMSRFYEGPGDGTSPLAGSVYEAIDRATTAGVVWVGAAGNLALRHWRGSFSDADGDGVHRFDAERDANCLQASAGDWIAGFLRWDDDWSAPVSDVELALLLAGEPLAISADRQTGSPGQVPLESLAVEAPADGVYCFAILLADGPPPEWVELASFGHDLEQSSPLSSVAAPGDARSPGALTVGAAPWFEPTRIEPFSGWGRTTDGRLKPDLVGFDRRRAAVLGGGVFVGTSQAAPHVSGLVALTRQAMPSLDTSAVADLLTSEAVIPPGGSPEAWGYGLARLAAVGDAEDVAGDAGCPGPDALCLGGGRFAVTVDWTAPDGRRGSGRPRLLTDDSGVFTFFDPDNVELVVKVLDGCSLNGRFWVFAGGLTDLALALEVRDDATLQARRYRSEGGAPFATLRDVGAFGGCSLGRERTGPAAALGDGWTESVTLHSRFRVAMRWSSGARSGVAIGQALGADSAAFAFFDRDNLEVVLKVLDGRPVNGAWWVYASGITDVGVDIRVEDTRDGSVRTWSSPDGTPFVPVTDIEAFRP